MRLCLPRLGLQDGYARMRRRMLDETELALYIGLRFPEHMRRIPIMEVGTARFRPSFAAAFWEDVLDLDEADMALLEEASATPYCAGNSVVDCRWPVIE